MNNNYDKIMKHREFQVKITAVELTIKKVVTPL